MEKRPPDVPDADAQEQSRDWNDNDAEESPAIPLDEPEADVLDQERPADLDDEEHETP